MPKASQSFQKSWVDRLKQDPEMALEYLQVSLKENGDDPKVLLSALRTIAEVRGFEELEEESSLSQKSLYKILSLSPSNHPRFETIHKIVDALGLQLTVEPKGKNARFG